MEFETAEEFESYLQSPTGQQKEAARSRRRVLFWRGLAKLPSLALCGGIGFIFLLSAFPAVRNAIFSAVVSCLRTIVA
ncbi:MAG: hypothetical protein AAGG44_20870 [Planctomycetota bacterium]